MINNNQGLSMKTRVTNQIFLSAAIALVVAAPATSMASRIFYKPDSSGGWQGPAQSEPMPTSYGDAVEGGFFYIFDSHYPLKGGSGWGGGLVTIDGRLFDKPVLESDCRLQLGGYIWEENNSAHMAITHARLGKPVPSGFPPNDDICTSGGGFPDIDLFFNNGLPGGTPHSGTWKVSQPIGNVIGPNAVFTASFSNTQASIFGMSCSNAAGDSGSIPTSYADNGAGAPASFEFNAVIAPNGIFSCATAGMLHSVWETAINEPDWTPSAPGPNSSISRGVVDYIQ